MKTKNFFLSKGISALLFVCAVLPTALPAQEERRQSIFDGFMSDRFISGQNSGDTDYLEDDAEPENDAEADETDETERSVLPPKPQDAAGGETSPAGRQEEAEAQRQKNETEPQSHSSADPVRHRYFLRSVHGLHKGTRLSAGVSGRGYIGFLQLESPMPMPYFELSVKNFGAGVYPLASVQAAYPEKHIPALFLGAGCLRFGRFLKTADLSGYAKIRPSYAGVKLPGESFIGMGSSQKSVHYGIELYGGGWNGTFFASPEPKSKRMRYGLLGGWHMNRKKNEIGISLQYLTGFMPELTGKEEPPSDKAAAAQGQEAASGDVRRRYHSLFGLNLVFTHPIVSFQTTGFCSYAADKTVSGGAQAECGLWYRYAGVNTGVSYTGRNAIGWDDKRQKERLTAFVQPYVKAGIFSLHTLYSLDKEEKTPLQSAGAVIQVRHKVIRWLSSWNYRNELHTVKGELACVSMPAWFRSIQWFQKATFGVSVELQPKAVNPLILKKYTAHVGGDFCITEGVFCGIRGTLTQSVGKEETETERIMFLKPPVCGSAVFVRFKRNGIEKVHSGKLELSVKNGKPYFDIKIGYQMQGR